MRLKWDPALRLPALLVPVLLLPAALRAQQAGAGEARVEPAVRAALSKAAPGERIPVLVEYADTTGARPPLGQGVRAMQRFAAPLLDALEAGARSGTGYRIEQRFWVVPAAAVQADSAGIRALEAQPGVRRIYLDERIPVSLEPPAPAGTPPAYTSDAMRTIGADAVWVRGVTGEGVTVAFFDSGVDDDNAMLSSRWRGRRTSVRSAWFDPFTRTSSPIDLIGHGTQVALATVGALPAGDTLAMPDSSHLVAASDLDVVSGTAPRAEWIAARIFQTFGGQVYTRKSVILQAYQWAMDPDGDPATDDAPDVINNSWGTLPGSDVVGACQDIVYQAIDAVEADGIAVVFAAGNSGPAASTIAAPANRDDPDRHSFAVGATEGTGDSVAVASYSSRGPSTCNGGIKPDLAAPGRVPQFATGSPTSVRLTGFTEKGTSFSTGEVSGALALLRQVAPGATPAQAKGYLTSSARDLAPSGPDDDTGAGLLDVPAAIQLADPSFTVALLQLSASPEGSDSARVRLSVRGDRAWDGGSLELRREFGAAVRVPVGRVAAGRSAEFDLPLPAVPGAGIPGAPSGPVRALARDLSGSLAASAVLQLSPPNLFGGFVLTAGELEAGGNDFGRVGRIAALSGFDWMGSELLPAGAFFVAGGDRISDGIYVTSLGSASTKTEPPAAETDWAPEREATDVSAAQALFRFDDRDALRPLGVRVAARLAASDSAGAGALELTFSVRNESGAEIADLTPGVFADWDLPGGESVAYLAAQRALAFAPLGAAGPVTLLAADTSVRASAPVPLGTPGSGGTYAAGSGVLATELSDSTKLALARGGDPSGLPGAGSATDEAGLLGVGPFDVAAGDSVLVRFWLVAAADRATALDRLARLRARPAVPPGGGGGGGSPGQTLTLGHPYPNPFRSGQGEITFPYTLSDAAAQQGGVLRLEIYDLAGRRLFSRRLSVGSGRAPTATWDGTLGDGRHAASGVYLYVLRLGDVVRTGKVLLLR